MTTLSLGAAPSTGKGQRWLLLGSLALNLFFIGLAIAMAVRPPPPSLWDRNVFVRTERLAASLPPADGAILRATIDAERTELDAAQSHYRASQDAVRGFIRTEPFDGNKVRAAMTQTRAARQTFDEVLERVFANATEKMSPAGRKAVAEWPPQRKTASKP